MSFAERIVVDTGIWISAALRPDSLPAQAVALAFARYEVCASAATLAELQHVLSRDKFDRYLPKAAREAFFDGVQQRVLQIEVYSEVSDCVDPKDNPFLALALDAGASGLKLFPSEMASPAVVKAVRAVLPPQVPVLAVGGIGAANMGDYLAAGAAGFGIGGSLFKPGKPLEDIAADARAIVSAFKAAL